MKSKELFVLIGCEESQAMCIAFRALGHNAYSCDLKACSGGHPEWHIIADVLTVLNGGYFTTESGNHIYIPAWDLGIFHPDCTYLTVSGLHRNKKNPARALKTELALEFVAKLLAAPIPRIALENPIGCISSRIRKPDQIIQPYQFGDDASKNTCLWLVRLPKLIHTYYFPPRITADGKKRWSNQTDDGQNKLIVDGKWIGYNDPRTKEHRSKTYPGIASAAASQWSEFILNQLEL